MNAPSAFGTYRVFHQTGNGVQGPVFRAFDSRQDRLVAIKAFTVDIAPARVVRLADALRQLVVAAAGSPPALVPLIEAGIEGTLPFLVMECQTGESLDALLRRKGPLSIEEAAPIVAGIAVALDQARAAGFGHGALHPRDVFVGPEQHVRVGGFGIVQAFERADVPMAIRRPYAAPERGGAWDIRADIYSLGVIAHEMFTGVRPSGTGEQDGAFVPSTSAAERVQLRRMLAMAMTERPDDRYQTGQAFADAIGAITRGARVTVPLDVAGERPAPAPISAPALPSSSELAPPMIGASAVDHDVIWPAGATRSPAAPRTPSPAASRRALVAAALAAVAFGSAIAYAVVRTLPRARVSSTVTRVDQSRRPPADIRLEAEPRRPDEAADAPDVAPLPDPAPAVADARVEVARTNRLDIRSEPSGALVTIDGRLSGATPTTVRALSPGTYVVRVARPGHVPREARVTVASASVRTLSFELEPGVDASMPSVGSLDVDSRPRGAEVLINGRLFGRTPLRAPGLRPGAYDVDLKLGGYAPASRRVTVVEGRPSTVNMTLQSSVR